MSANNFGVSANNPTKLLHTMRRQAGMRIWVQILGARSL